MKDNEIVAFVNSCMVATVCCIDDGMPWCFNCFYVCSQNGKTICFKSGQESRHAGLLSPGAQVSGTILPSTLNFAGLQGIQFDGTVVGVEQNIAAKRYCDRFPESAAVHGVYFTVDINHWKLTDNTKGFGYKVTWDPKTGFPSSLNKTSR